MSSTISAFVACCKNVFSQYHNSLHWRYTLGASLHAFEAPGAIPNSARFLVLVQSFWDSAIARVGHETIGFGESCRAEEVVVHFQYSTVCHTGTRNLATVTGRADILIVAMGRPRFITENMVKQGAVIIDVGVNRVEAPERKSGYRLVGDVDFDAVSEKVAAITPVPGGVGPMTIAMLLQNTLKAAQSFIDGLSH